MKRLLIILMACGIFAACKKDDLQQYTEKSRIYLSLPRAFYAPFSKSSARNLSIDYGPQNSSKKTDTLNLTVQASGPAAKEDRAFILVRNAAGGQATEGVDFDMLDKKFVVPAGMFNANVRVVIRRTPIMAKQAVSFAYELKANDNFELGPDRDTLNFTFNSAIMRITMLRFTATDIVVKPDNWESFIAKYFGVYSERKFRFIIDVLNKVSFPGTTPVGTMNTNLRNLRTALTKYNAEHPGEPLKDENNLLISF